MVKYIQGEIKVIKNKLNFIILIAFVFILFVFFSNETRASDYTVTITSIDGLEYGNKLKNATINGESNGVEGEFSFYNSEMVLDSVGEVNLEIVFIPLNSSEVKKINYVGIVEKRKISIAFDAPIYKQYDGNDNIVLPTFSYVGILNNEVEVVGELIGKLSATYVSEDIAITLSGVEIVGDKKDCYYLDLFEHTARIYPSILEKSGVNETFITLDENVYVDISYSLKVEPKMVNSKILNKYTAFESYSYEVYSHNNVKQDVDGNFDIKMKINDKITVMERLAIFELTKEGKYKKLEYSIHDGYIHTSIESGSQLVFATRDIEYHFIIFFSGVLIFYFLFVIVYRLKNSRIKTGKIY